MIPEAGMMSHTVTRFPFNDVSCVLGKHIYDKGNNRRCLSSFNTKPSDGACNQNPQQTDVSLIKTNLRSI